MNPDTNRSTETGPTTLGDDTSFPPIWITHDLENFRLLTDDEGMFLAEREFDAQQDVMLTETPLLDESFDLVGVQTTVTSDTWAALEAKFGVTQHYDAEAVQQAANAAKAAASQGFPSGNAVTDRQDNATIPGRIPPVPAARTDLGR